MSKPCPGHAPVKNIFLIQHVLDMDVNVLARYPCISNTDMMAVYTRVLPGFRYKIMLRKNGEKVKLIF